MWISPLFLLLSCLALFASAWTSPFLDEVVPMHREGHSENGHTCPTNRRRFLLIASISSSLPSASTTLAIAPMMVPTSWGSFVSFVPIRPAAAAVAAATATDESTTLMCSPMSSTPTAMATADTGSETGNIDELLRKSLQIPTEDKPPIPLPTSAVKSSSLVEGMIYLKDPKIQLPSSTDTVYITVHTVGEDQPPTILAGARIPVAKIRSWPVRFVMKRSNRLVTEDVFRSHSNEDWFVHAVVCSSSHQEGDSDAIPSVEEQVQESCRSPNLRAKAVAKLVSLSGSSQVRAPVSLPLQ